jgi:hypothetical protein
MALGGAWVITSLGGNFVIFQGRTMSADNDSEILGLNGDATADFNLPASFPVTSETLTDAQRHLRIRLRIVPLSDCGLAAAGASVGFSIEQGSAPWQNTIRMNGTPNAAVTLRLEVELIHSMIR